MKYFILKGWHFSILWFPRIYIDKQDYNWTVQFDESCKYDHGTPDQLDWNKLVGISNHLNPRKNSFRFVWRYNVFLDMFQIGTYLEKDGVFTARAFYNVKSDVPVNLKLKCYYTYAVVEINDITQQTVDFQKEYVTLRLNPYFGGNKTAPHKMSLRLW